MGFFIVFLKDEDVLKYSEIWAFFWKCPNLINIQF